MWLNNDFKGNMMDADVSSYGDDNFLYHINWFTSSSHNENHRENDKRDSVKSQCGSNYSAMNCQELEDAYWCLDDGLQNALASSTGSRGARRVRDRAIKVYKDYKGQVEKYQDSRDCEGGTSGLDAAQQQNIDYQAQIEQYNKDMQLQQLQNQSNLDKQAYEMQQMMMMQKAQSDKDKKMLMYGGIGIAVILLGALILKK